MSLQDQLRELSTRDAHVRGLEEEDRNAATDPVARAPHTGMGEHVDPVVSLPANAGGGPANRIAKARMINKPIAT